MITMIIANCGEELFLTKTANLFVVFAPGVAKACIVVAPYFIYSHFSLKLDVNSLISENNSLLSRCCSTTIALFKISLSRSGLKVISDIVLLRDLSICLTVEAIRLKPSG
jgi:hypothetical protein